MGNDLENGLGNDDYKNQKMNEKQKENWISIDEIKEKYNVLSTDANLMFE